MRFVVTLRDGSPAGSQTEVLVDADPRSPFADLLPRLLAAFDDGTHPSFAAGVQVWVDGVPVDAIEQASIAAVGLRPGAIVELHSARERPAGHPAGVAEVRVVNGPGAGRVHRLTLGHTVAGFDAPGMALADRQLPAHALTVIATAGGQVDVEPVAGVAATLDGEAITARTPWPMGAYLVTGRTVLELAAVAPGPAPADTGAGTPATRNRGGRASRHALPDLTVTLIRPPKPPSTPPGGWPVTGETPPHHGGTSPSADLTGSEEQPAADAAAGGSHPADPDGPADPTGPADTTHSAGHTGARAAGAPHTGPPHTGPPHTGPPHNGPKPVAAHREGRAWRWAPGGGRSPNHRQDRRSSSATSHRITGPSAAVTQPATPRPASRVEQARARRLSTPDPARLLLSTVARDAAVWHRFPGDEDFLRLRIGLGERDGLPDVPVWADLAGIGVLGIAGDPETAHGLAAWLMAQCAVMHSPQQLRLAVLTTNQYQARRRWEWLVRVPSSAPGGVAAAPDDPEPPVVALVGTDDESIEHRLAELSGLIADRRLLAATSSTPSTTPIPRVVVLLDGFRQLRGRPGLTELLSDGPDAGVYTICVDEEENWLPPGCREVISCTTREARLQSGGQAVRPDGVEPAWTDQLSRLLAPLRDGSPPPDPGTAPEGGLLSMLGLDVPGTGKSPAAQLERLAAAHWGTSPNGRAVIGTGHDGPFAVDLRLDGPHLLVAGEPAARPDAMLAVVVASLAAANRPDHLNAILISTRSWPELDACASLPHVTGAVSLDAAEGDSPTGEEPIQRLQRALAGISAELDHRDALLSRAGARDLDDYAARAQRLPRLLVVVHDVVELAEQLPGGLAELVSAAQRGESLGLNLLLGTARPEDIASHEIASVLCANATLRICLRVDTETASRSIIDAAQAARIPRRAQGRGYARMGHWPLLSFQAPRLGSAVRTTARLSPPDVGADPGPDEPLAWALPWDDVGHPAPGRAFEGASAADDRATPLATEIATLATATTAAASTLMIPAPQPPWLPPLPRVVQATAVRSQLRPATVDLTDPVGAPHPWALEEHPDTQTRSVSSIELGRSGHLLISGAPGSGRTTALHTIAGVLADRVSAADLHIYALDNGDGGLAPLAELPHTGALVRRSERARAGRVLGQLVEEVAARRETLTAHSWADVDEQRAAAGSEDRLPYLMLIIDRWEALAAGPDGDTLSEQVLVLLRRGAAAGLHVVVTGERALLSGRVSALAVPCLLLRPDTVDYGLAGLKPARQPAPLPPGRGVWADSGVLVQVCVLAADTSSGGRTAAIDDIARRRARRNASIPESLRPVRL